MAKKKAPAKQRTNRQLNASKTNEEGYPLAALADLPVYEHKIIVTVGPIMAMTFNMLSAQGWEHYQSHSGGNMPEGQWSQTATTHYFRKPRAVPMTDSRAGKKGE